MTPEYSTWFHSSHRENTSCNDCHVPHDNTIRKYWFKANDGLRHATTFTFGLEPQVIKIKTAGQDVVQNNCIRCHNNLIGDVSLVANHSIHNSDARKCWDCHREVPHSRVHGQASTPNTRVPRLKPAILD
jgi:cytochrome c nitrite reductase small subunit